MQGDLFEVKDPKVDAWIQMVPDAKGPLFFVIAGAITQATFYPYCVLLLLAHAVLKESRSTCSRPFVQLVRIGVLLALLFPVWVSSETMLLKKALHFSFAADLSVPEPCKTWHLVQRRSVYTGHRPACWKNRMLQTGVQIIDICLFYLIVVVRCDCR